MDSKTAKAATLNNFEESASIKKIFGDIKTAIANKQFFVHYSNNEHNSTFNDWEYLKSLGYEVQWTTRKKHELYCTSFVTEVLISWA